MRVRTRPRPPEGSEYEIAWENKGLGFRVGEPMNSEDLQKRFARSYLEVHFQTEGGHFGGLLGIHCLDPPKGSEEFWPCLCTRDEFEPRGSDSSIFGGLGFRV